MHDTPKPMPSSLTSLAFHLPQYHEIPENNQWWGEGFTEWTQLRKARPWNKRHVVRRPIAPLGEYSLLDPASLELQWHIAEQHGISGFAVWNYWFGNGKQLLEQPIELVLAKKLKFRYCLAWANHSWYDKSRNKLLCKQEYLGPTDYERYFDRVFRHFETDNYIKIDGKPVFIIFDPHSIPERERFFDQWRKLAQQRGFPGIHLVADRLSEKDALVSSLDNYSAGFNFLTRRNRMFVNYAKEHLSRRLSIELGPRWFDFRKLTKELIPADAGRKFAPTILTGWDTTPRHGRRGVVFNHLDVAAFKVQLTNAAQQFAKFDDAHHLLFLKSWNEWAEGNVLEPDTVFGFELLEVYRAFSSAYQASNAES